MEIKVSNISNAVRNHEIVIYALIISTYIMGVALEKYLYNKKNFIFSKSIKK